QKVKKFIIPALMAAGLFAASCKNNSELVISGKIENAGDIKKVMLYEGDMLVDSAFLNEDSRFKFRRLAPDANFYTVAIGEKNFLVVGKNGEELVLSTDYQDTTDTYQVEGSEDSKKIREVTKISAEYGKIYEKIQERYAAAINANPASKDSILNVLLPEFQANMD